MSITNQQEWGTPEKKEILGLDGKPLDTENLLKIPERRIHYQQNPDSIYPDKRELKHIPIKGNIINPVFLVKNNAIYDNWKQMAYCLAITKGCTYEQALKESRGITLKMKNLTEIQEASVEVGKFKGIERIRGKETTFDIVHEMTHEYFDVLCGLIRALNIAESEVVNAIKEGLDINYFLLTEMVRLGLKYIGENETADIIHKIERGFESPDQIIHPAFIGFTQEVTEKIMTKELATNFSSSETSFFTDTNGELSRHVSEGNHAIDTLDGRMRTGGLTLEQARNTVGVEKARAINTSQMIQDIGLDDYFRITGKFQPEDGQEKLSPEQNAEKVSEKSELIQAGLIEKQSEIYSRSVSALEKKTQESQERLGELGMSAEEFFALQDMKRREEMKKLQEEVSARETKNNKHNGELQRRFGGMRKLR